MEYCKTVSKVFNSLSRYAFYCDYGFAMNDSFTVAGGNEASQLSKYLLKTLCSDLMNMVILSLAEENGLSFSSDQTLSSTVWQFKLEKTNLVNWHFVYGCSFVQERNRLITSLPIHMREDLTLVNESLAGKVCRLSAYHYNGICWMCILSLGYQRFLWGIWSSLWSNLLWYFVKEIG